MKTLKGWEKSGIDLDEYLTEPCRIDEGLANYIGECVAPVYVTPQFIQGGDPIKEEDDVLFYRTVSIVGDKYFNIGILPEFK
jgi:hypothetical protein